ncbi:2192_t:CDS:2, partial [Funneliformis geosporum]
RDIGMTVSRKSGSTVTVTKANNSHQMAYPTILELAHPWQQRRLVIKSKSECSPI